MTSKRSNLNTEQAEQTEELK